MYCTHNNDVDDDLYQIDLFLDAKSFKGGDGKYIFYLCHKLSYESKNLLPLYQITLPYLSHFPHKTLNNTQKITCKTIKYKTIHHYCKIEDSFQTITLHRFHISTSTNTDNDNDLFRIRATIII